MLTSVDHPNAANTDDANNDDESVQDVVIFDGNPTDIVKVLYHQYPQLKSDKNATTSPTQAIQFLTSIIESDYQFKSLINSIQQQLKQRIQPLISDGDTNDNNINDGDDGHSKKKKKKKKESKNKWKRRDKKRYIDIYSDDDDDEDDEDFDIVNDDDFPSDYTTTTPSDISQSIDRNDRYSEHHMANLEGDPNHIYKDGDCVWAKYSDFPWWPGQIKVDDQKSNKSTVTVKWFYDIDPKSNECELTKVVPWDPEHIHRIYVEVDEEDKDSFHDSVGTVNTVYLQICEERGEEALQSALEYEGNHKQQRTSKKRPLSEFSNGTHLITSTPKRQKRGRNLDLYISLAPIHWKLCSIEDEGEHAEDENERGRYRIKLKVERNPIKEALTRIGPKTFSSDQILDILADIEDNDEIKRKQNVKKMLKKQLEEIHGCSHVGVSDIKTGKRGRPKKVDNFNASEFLKNSISKQQEQEQDRSDDESMEENGEHVDDGYVEIDDVNDRNEAATTFTKQYDENMDDFDVSQLPTLGVMNDKYTEYDNTNNKNDADDGFHEANMDIVGNNDSTLITKINSNQIMELHDVEVLFEGKIKEFIMNKISNVGHDSLHEMVTKIKDTFKEKKREFADEIKSNNKTECELVRSQIVMKEKEIESIKKEDNEIDLEIKQLIAKKERNKTLKLDKEHILNEQRVKLDEIQKNLDKINVMINKINHNDDTQMNNLMIKSLNENVLKQLESTPTHKWSAKDVILWLKSIENGKFNDDDVIQQLERGKVSNIANLRLECVLNLIGINVDQQYLIKNNVDRVINGNQ